MRIHSSGIGGTVIGRTNKGIDKSGEILGKCIYADCQQNKGKEKKGSGSHSQIFF
jgi:hypothetical protein